MAILATDILIKTMLEASINDLRKNSFLLDDVFSGLAASNDISNTEYGYKEVQAAKEWFLANNIPVFLGFRTDTPTFPCISVVQQSSNENTSRASLADQGMIEPYDVERAGKPIQKVLPDFTPAQYDPKTKMVILPEQHSTDLVAVGMYLLTKSGHPYVIKELNSGRAFTLADTVKHSLTDCCVVPATNLWNLHRELTYMDETYSIGLHANSEPQFNIWLRQLAIYILLRYKEVLLEARGFELSTFNIAPMQLNASFTQDRVFSTYITLSGTVQADWIKFVAPKLAKATARIRVGKVVSAKADLQKIMTPEQYKEQVKSQTWCMENDVFADVMDNDSEGLDTVGEV